MAGEISIFDGSKHYFDGKIQVSDDEHFIPLESTFLMVKFLSITKICWLNQYKTTSFIVNAQLLDGELQQLPALEAMSRPC